VLRALPEPTAALVQRVLEAADAASIGVHLVGGPVRDLLLGRSLRDVDLVVERAGEGDAAALARRVATPELRIVSHDRFGTVTLRAEHASLDLATVRKETYAHEGALPTVEPGSLEDDLERRDFTVNAMALPLSATARRAHSGIVGVERSQEDLEGRRLRILHRRSFHDDPTRALRAARFAPRLGFTLTRDSRAALRGALRDGAFGRVSGDRWRRELTKLFDDCGEGLDPARALRLLDHWHVLPALEPGLGFDRGSAPALRRLGRAVAAPPWPSPRWRPWVSGLALWLEPLPAPLRRRALRRFSVRGEHADVIVQFHAHRARWLEALELARGRGRVDAVLIEADEHSLHALHAAAPPALRRRIARWANEDRSRKLPINGRDLVELGLEGPAVGRALLRIRTAVLDGTVGSRDEALALARELSRRRARRAADRKPKEGR
jgi:tRNA nucleotidyltransferase (CCA-adding enzyme)